MFNKGIDFPQYRKLSNDKVFVRINNDRQFDEVQIIGKKARFHTVEAIQYPEILKIIDLLSYEMEGYLESNEKEFKDLLKRYSL
ncbi:MAG: hypothetical protein HRT57_15905 [Crocinitomicaceae bacterium]|nr:hypothetical protein [Crocinitomicaceae bacterium]